MSEEQLLREARAIFDAALRECSVERAFDRKMRVHREKAGAFLSFDTASIGLTRIRYLRIVAVGKASSAMLSGFLSRAALVPGCEVKGVLIDRNLPEGLHPGIEFFAGRHPHPNQASFDGARAAIDLVQEASTLDHALILFFISGGASSMMELPLSPHVSLEDTAVFYQSLVQSGATISEINCIRKHFSAVKGGRLALAAGATPAFTLLVSDVPPAHLDALGSGPTLPDPSTVQECRELLLRYRLADSLPASIRDYLLSPSLLETPKPGEFKPRLCVLLDSNDLATAAEQHARSLGYYVVIDNTCDDWSYTRAAEYLLSRLRLLRTRHTRVCLLSVGEISVPVPIDLATGLSHRGGRNQHFALHMAALLAASDRPMAVLSAGSDGIDGNSAVAGAVIGAETLHGAFLLPQARLALDAFDSSTFLEARGATIVTGATGNNLRDLRILLAG